MFSLGPEILVIFFFLLELICYFLGSIQVPITTAVHSSHLQQKNKGYSALMRDSAMRNWVSLTKLMPMKIYF